MNSKLDSRTVSHYTLAYEKGSTGSFNSMFEVAVRRYIAKRYDKILYTAGQGKADARVGRAAWLEIKSCCGELGDIEDPLRSIHRAQYVLYTPDLPDEMTICNDAKKCFETCLVFSQRQFIEMLCYIHKDGTPHIKLNAQRGRYNIQTLRTFNKKTGKWSQKPYDKFWEYVDEYGIPNATDEWLESIRK